MKRIGNQFVETGLDTFVSSCTLCFCAKCMVGNSVVCSGPLCNVLEMWYQDICGPTTRKPISVVVKIKRRGLRADTILPHWDPHKYIAIDHDVMESPLQRSLRTCFHGLLLDRNHCHSRTSSISIPPTNAHHYHHHHLSPTSFPSSAPSTQQ